MFQNVSLHSYKGPNAIKIDVAKTINAFSFVTNAHFKNAMIVIGYAEHCYMLRFSYDNGKFFLSDVFEVRDNIAEDIIHNQIVPHSYEWNLCEVCCSSTTMHCKHCKVRYCSKLCQKIDWKNHKKYCTKNDNVCIECSE